MHKKQLIVGVEPDSIADELNIKAGDHLLTVNSSSVRDVFDYRFFEVDEEITIEIEKEDGSIEEYEIEKDYGTELGILFESALMDESRACANKCIFCFIDQMPKGMRPTLYFKDDDSRLSFLQGNYVTLTNMKEEEIDRLIRYRMEPINISVHTTDPVLRCMMLGNRFAGDALKYLDKLYLAGIKMNGQIVVCKGVNDGKALEKTLSDLSGYAPVMQSVSVVPAGLTKYRKGLYPLEPLSRKDALDIIKTVEKYQQRIYNDYSTHFVHASDEFYLLAGLDVPDEDSYDGYPQLENGVGMLRLLESQFSRENAVFSQKYADNIPENRHISLATGTLACPYMKRFAAEAEKSAGGRLRIDVYEVKSLFFGENVTVSGLITGSDIIDALSGKELHDELLLPVNMFRAGEDYFLDDIKKSEIEKKLNVKVTIVPNNGEALMNAFAGIKNRDFRRQIYEQADSGYSGKT